MALSALLASLVVAATGSNMLASVPSGVLAGPQFTFQVPVNVQHLGPRYDRIQVFCGVLANQSDTNFLAEDSVLKPLTNGAFAGTVVVSFNLPAGQDPSQAHYYRCKLLLAGGQGILDDPSLGFDAYDTPKPGTTAVVIAQGALP